MTKLSMIVELLKCKICNNVLNDPVLIPCGESICASHIRCSEHKIKVSSNICKICERVHLVPKDGYQRNKTLDKILDLITDLNNEETNKVQFSWPFFKQNQSDQNQISLKRKNTIGPSENVMISETNKNKITIMGDVIQNVSIPESMEQTRPVPILIQQNLPVQKQQEIPIPMKRNILVPIPRQRFIPVLSKSTQQTTLFQIPIQKITSFTKNDELSLKLKQIDYSKILRDQSASELITLCEFDTEQKWKRIYCGSEDGFRACDFFTYCQNFGQTLTVIESTNGSIFGGYASQKWLNHGFVDDGNAFLFSLVNPTSNPMKIKCDDAKHALYVNRSTNEGRKRGVTFGALGNYGFDLCIKSESNQNARSYSNLGLTYGRRLFNFNSQTFLTGSYQFQTKEIEVFCKV